MRKLYLAATAITALAFVQPAHAVLQLSANINGTIISCADGAGCDTNPLPNQLKIADQFINGVEIQGSSQFAVAGATNDLNTTSFQIVNHNTSAATIQLAINGINFVGPVQTYAASGAGTWQNAGGSTATLTWYGDASNTQGANSPTDLPGTLLQTFSDTANGAADSFATGQLTGAFTAGNLFGMSLGTLGTLAAWNGNPGEEATLVGRAQAIVSNQVVDTPEPAALAIMGVGMLGLGLVRRKKPVNNAECVA